MTTYISLLRGINLGAHYKIKMPDLNANLFENKWKVQATTRNWRTVSALVEMVKET